jgi:hypothetical protein
MDTKAIKSALAEQYPAEDYKLVVKLVIAHEVKTRVTPYHVHVDGFIAVGVEAKRANGENWKGQARKVHPGEEEVLAVLRNAGFKAVPHCHSFTAQMIAVVD